MKTMVHIIFNPVAGGGKAKKLKSQLVHELERRFGKNYLIMETSGQGDAIILAREAAERGVWALDRTRFGKGKGPWIFFTTCSMASR